MATEVVLEQVLIGPPSTATAVAPGRISLREVNPPIQWRAVLSENVPKLPLNSVSVFH